MILSRIRTTIKRYLVVEQMIFERSEGGHFSECLSGTRLVDTTSGETCEEEQRKEWGSKQTFWNAENTLQLSSQKSYQKKKITMY